MNDMTLKIEGLRVGLAILYTLKFEKRLLFNGFSGVRK